MKVLITGNSGYIGSHLTQLLLEKTDYTVHGVDIAHPNEKIQSIQRHSIGRWNGSKKMIFCLHSWTKWSEPIPTNDHVKVQSRYCTKCNKYHVEKIKQPYNTWFNLKGKEND